MRHVFQVEQWEKHPSVGVHLVYYGKGHGKGFGKGKDINWHFIYENNEKQEKRKVKGNMLHMMRKLKENNRN